MLFIVEIKGKREGSYYLLVFMFAHGLYTTKARERTTTKAR
jgi:hypothetical protein